MLAFYIRIFYDIKIEMGRLFIIILPHIAMQRDIL